jgi:integrase
MRRQRGARIYGPYKHGRRWRAVTRGGGKELVASFPTKEEAELAIASFNAAKQGRTIGMAIDAYIADLERRGCRPVSVSASTQRLARLIPATERARPLRELTAARAKRLYLALVDPERGMAVDTHHNSHREATQLCAWLIKVGWMSSNPFAAVEKIGRKKQGRPQLTANEARAFAAIAVPFAEDGDVAALGGMLCLLLGLGNSEVINRVGRDVDDEGKLLWVPFGKTKARRRVVEVPPLLREALRRRLDAIDGHERLIPYEKCAFTRAVNRILRLAGVPTVGTHGLRATHASLAIEAGATSHMVAKTLGHASPRMTEQHYIRPEVTASASARRAGAALGTGSSRSVTMPTKPEESRDPN